MFAGDQTSLPTNLQEVRILETQEGEIKDRPIDQEAEIKFSLLARLVFLEKFHLVQIY